MKKQVKPSRDSYTIEQKNIVINFAKQYGRNKAAAHFNLDASMVGRWVKASANWNSEISLNSKRIGSGRKAYYPEAERKLYDWLIGQRKQGLAVTYTILKIQMLDILKEPDMAGLYNDVSRDFKTSDRWLSAFMKRYNLSWRRRTKISQKMPEQTQELLSNFHKFVTELRIEKSFEPCNILNMDETPVWFDMAGNFTVEQKGAKTVQIRSTGNEKNRFTVVLTCAAGKYFIWFD